MSKATFQVNGMHCASCAIAVEKALKQVSGVANASVNLIQEKAYVTFEDQEVELERLFQSVSDAGYQLTEEPKSIELKNKVYFSLKGMSCASCAQTIERVVNKLTFVDQASVNLTTETLTVEAIEGNQVDIESVIQAVEAAGYHAAVMLTAQEQFQQDQRDKQAKLQSDQRRLGLMTLLTLPLFYIAMGPMLGLPIPETLSPHHHPLAYALIQLILTSGIMMLAREIMISGYRSLFKSHPNMNALVAIGTTAAYLQGLVMLLGLYFHANFVPQGHVPLYFESAGVILTLITFGNYLEDVAKGKTSEAVQALMKLSPDRALKINDKQQLIEVAIEEVEVGDHLLVKPGQRIPLDGVIIEGETTIDESMLTGESFPVVKSVGDSVTGATFNSTGAITFQVTRIGADTTLSQIVTMIQEAQGTKAPISRLADRISAYFVPVVMILAIVSAFSWYIATHDIYFALNIFISVLIIACPCALGLATPTAMMVATGKGAKQGILIKSGASLELMKHADVVLLDKTGTITQGKPQVQAIEVVSTMDKDTVLLWAASLEQLSQHPLGQAVVDYAREQGISLLNAENFESKTGFGISGQVDDQMIIVGNAAYLGLSDIEIALSFMDASQEYARKGLTPLFVAVNQKFAGLIVVGDAIKSSSPSAIRSLQTRGIQVAMVTGDNDITAQAIGQQVGIDTIYSQVLPEHKVDVVKELQKQSKKVLMVGDGINDAPALTQADIGMAIGSGSDVAIESADVILINDQLSDVNKAIDLSQRTNMNIRQNLFWAFIYNVIGIPFAMGLIYLIGGPLLNPMIAAAAMSFSSISVLLNALRIK